MKILFFFKFYVTKFIVFVKFYVLPNSMIFLCFLIQYCYENYVFQFYVLPNSIFYQILCSTKFYDISMFINSNFYENSVFHQILCFTKFFIFNKKINIGFSLNYMIFAKFGFVAKLFGVLYSLYSDF